MYIVLLIFISVHVMHLYLHCFRAMFSLGEHTHKVPMALHKLNRDRLCEELKSKGVEQGAVIMLQGGSDCNRYCSDVNFAPFRQVQNCCLI